MHSQESGELVFNDIYPSVGQLEIIYVLSWLRYLL